MDTVPTTTTINNIHYNKTAQAPWAYVKGETKSFIIFNNFTSAMFHEQSIGSILNTQHFVF